MEQRKYGTNPLAESKAEAEEKVDKKKRYNQIISILKNSEGMTAKEIACEMHKLHYTPTNERNFASPRLTELLKLGIVDCIGKKTCEYTGVSVGVFKLCEGVELK